MASGPRVPEWLFVVIFVLSVISLVAFGLEYRSKRHQRKGFKNKGRDKR